MRQLALILILTASYDAKANDALLPPIPPSMANSLTQPVATLDAPTFYFASGQSELDDRQKQHIKDFANRIVGINFYLFIDAYTDNVGDPQTNLKLSQARANAVADVFHSAGLHRDQTLARGYGEYEARGETKEERQSERRVIITVRLPLSATNVTKNKILSELRARSIPFDLLAAPSNIPEMPIQNAQLIETRTKTHTAILGFQVSPVSLAMIDGKGMRGGGISANIELPFHRSTWSGYLRYMNVNFPAYVLQFQEVGIGQEHWSHRYIAWISRFGLGLNNYKSSEDSSAHAAVSFDTSLRAQIPQTQLGGQASLLTIFSQDAVCFSILLGISAFL